MIDTILHSVEEAEEKADQILRDARTQVQRIGGDTDLEVDRLKRKQRELFDMEADSKRKLARDEEARKDEEARLAVTREIEELWQNAKAREDRIVERLAAQII